MVAAAVVFAPTLGTYFSQDDWVFLSHTYKQPFVNIFRHYSETFYRPVGQQLFFWIGGRIFGLEASGFHLLGLLVHLLNIILLWKLFRYFPAEQGPASRDKILSNTKLFLLLFYAVNPAHFVALNWLTQVDIEIAVSLALVSTYILRPGLYGKGQAFLLQICGVVLYLLGVLSHEIVAFLPVVWWIWFKQKRTAVLGLIAGLSLIGAKFLANPFSSNADYTISINILGIISSLKWYGLRALFLPEGIRNFPVWLAAIGLVPAIFLMLIFRQKLVDGVEIYLLGVLPVLGFGGHLLAAYAVFGIALMVIELGRVNVIPAPGQSRGQAPAGIYLNRFRVPPSLTVCLQKLFVYGSRSAFRRAGKPGMTVFLASVVILMATAGFIYFNYLNHWSTTRGIISQRLTEDYLVSDLKIREEISARANNFKENPEIYFSSMSGKQFEVLDLGLRRGIFDKLFYRGNDLTTQFLPDALFFKDSILAGKFPIWNQWIMAGLPYFLDPQNFLWYPPNYFLLLLPIELGFLILLIGHLVFAGLFVGKISDILQKGNWIGWLGAGMFVFSPKIISHIEEGNWSLVIAASWLPFLYWALKNKRLNWTIISLSAIIINNLNIGYYAALFVMLYFLTHLSQKRSLLIEAKRLIKVLIVTVALTIPRWLPLALFGNQTVRVNLQESPLPFWSWTKIFKSLFFPLAGGHPVLQNEEILYVGILPIILGIIFIYIFIYQKGVSFLKLKGARELIFWLVWLGFISLVAVNLKTPLFYLTKLLPGFSLLRITTRPWTFVSLAQAIFVSLMIKGLAKRSKLLAGALAIVILLEYAYFDYGIFSRRQMVKNEVPYRFYQTMASAGNKVRAYCTTGCLDRLTAQKMGIALLDGNNPIQLTEFVNYLQKAGGYTETSYFPILPPYPVFNQQPQPNAELLELTATRFVISSYELTDRNFELKDQYGEYRLYLNTVKLMETKDHYFNL